MAYQDSREGELVIGRKRVALTLESSHTISEHARMDILVSTIESIAVGTSQDSSIIMTLRQAPSFYSLAADDDIEEDYEYSMTASFQRLNLGLNELRRRARLLGLHAAHHGISGYSLVYRLVLKSHEDMPAAKAKLRSIPGGPGVILLYQNIPMRLHHVVEDLQKLAVYLSDSRLCAKLPWSIRFQLQRLGQNGYLPAKVVVQLLARIVRLHTKCARNAEQATAQAIRNMSRSLPYAGPEADPAVFCLEELIAAVQQHIDNFVYRGSVYDLVRRHPHLGLIHQALVTPTGTFLDGPELETRNRVLRKYLEHSDCFLRVTFCEEDGDRLRYEAKVDREAVFVKAYGGVLDNGLKIAEKHFHFLGFSHSSLRSQQCWFLSPFDHTGERIASWQLIERLGDFSHIRTPARAAARIGQAFSDATDVVAIQWSAIRLIPDVERNGRCFSDGCGTISESQLRKVWNVFYETRKARATQLQIRFQGAKGMLSLDPELQGDQICLRKSMVKFEGSPDMNLEICGASRKPLPMFLNKQFIKILEDLGTPPKTFHVLQEKALQWVRLMISQPVNAAKYLEMQHIGLATRMPLLIRTSNTELALLWENAYTLHGIMDETAYLKPGQIHAVVQQQDGTVEAIVGRCLITRAPALHPGDMQMVESVPIPENSPNLQLRNAVLFSQLGERDLASMLSGGDLDGDLFCVTWDETLFPKFTEQPADYDRVKPEELDRPVRISDMTAFFVDFMRNDLLGHVSNTHLQIADQKVEGTRSATCKRLAGLASTAVDYSKTGICVNMRNMPTDREYARRCKPDYMAYAPGLVIHPQNGISLNNEDETAEDRDDDPVANLDHSKASLYYESPKVLGQLYRNIDERKFLSDFHDPTSGIGAGAGAREDSLMGKIVKYIGKSTHLIHYSHHWNLACEIREAPFPRHPISELEVWCGTIMGKTGLPNKRTRETAVGLKEKFERDVAFYEAWILSGDAADVDDGTVDAVFTGQLGSKKDAESMERSLACFMVGMSEQGRAASRTVVKSFKYFALGLLLREMEERFGRLPRNTDV
ncbi:hypothetical protein MRB53_037167 [Persea americana]|nr:hypothetical protein MRB53_037167 [Persea americana]